MKIHNYKPIGKGLMVAGCDIEVEQWGVTFRGCILFEKGNNKWIGFPSRKYDGADGKPAYYAYVTMDKEKKIAFDRTAIQLCEVEAARLVAGSNQSPAAQANDEETPPW